MGYTTEASELREVPRPPKPRQRGRFVVFGGALALALVVAGAVVVPKVVHEQRVAKHRQLVAETQTLNEQAALSAARSEAARALYEHAIGEAEGFAEQLVTLSKVPEPIVLADRAKDVSTAAATLAAELAELRLDDTEKTDAAKKLSAAVQTARKADSEAASTTQEAAEKAPAPSVAASWHEMSVSAAQKLAFAPEPAKRPRSVASRSVTPQTVTAAETARKNAAAAARSALKDARAAEQQVSTLAVRVEVALDAVRPVAESAPKQAQQVVAGAEKAGDTAKLTTAARAAAEGVTEEKPGLEVKRLVDAFVTEAQATQQAHAKAVAEEMAQAAAEAAAGEGGYIDPGTGGNAPLDNGGGSWSGGDGGWAGGNSGGSWGGGGSSGESAGGGSGGGSSSGGDSGYVPPPHACPPPPAPGWYDTGATGNGCPIYAPPGSGGADEW